MTIRYTSEAHRDLLEAIEHVARTDAPAASRLADRIGGELDLGTVELASAKALDRGQTRSCAPGPSALTASTTSVMATDCSSSASTIRRGG